MSGKLENSMASERRESDGGGTITKSLGQRDELFRLLVESVQDYAIFTGAERIKGYKASEIIGEHFSRFYSLEAKEGGWPEREFGDRRIDGAFHGRRVAGQKRRHHILGLGSYYRSAHPKQRRVAGVLEGYPRPD
jgi:hypothetical protein